MSQRGCSRALCSHHRDARLTPRVLRDGTHNRAGDQLPLQERRRDDGPHGERGDGDARTAAGPGAGDVLHDAGIDRIREKYSPR